MTTACGVFPSTDWSVVRRASSPWPCVADHALATLCETYWRPLYAVLRHRGYDSEDAKDLTQAFIASVVEKNRGGAVLPAHGRLRAFLRTAVLNFAANECHRAAARKRGGGWQRVAADTADQEWLAAAEPADRETPERLFDRRWATTLLNRVLQRLALEYAVSGRADLFARLEPSLVGDGDRAAYVDAATACQMSDAAVRMAAMRLRRRYRRLLREEIAQTVTDPSSVDDEIRHLLAVVGAS